jgi:hypothetical protein
MYGDYGLTERQSNNKREVAMKIRTDRTDLSLVIMYGGVSTIQDQLVKLVLFKRAA